MSAVAAVGIDGDRWVVWGLGTDKRDALEDSLTENGFPAKLTCVEVDREQEARIIAGEIDCLALGIEVPK